jgi:uncharacterized Zn finger protein
VAIQIKALSSADWQEVVRGLSKQALFTAKLLAGDMPQDIEEIFKKARLSLFPEKLKDLKTECSCPDWSNPCKHIAAVYYLLGEEFDRDPFLVFKLRGIGREEFLALLGKRGKESPPKGRKTKAAPPPEKEEIPSPGEPLAVDLSVFWSGRKMPEPLFGEVRIPPVPAALPKRLGNFPFWRGEIKFLDVMETIYPQAAGLGLDLFLGVNPFGSAPREKLTTEPKGIFPKKRKGDFSPYAR